MLILLYYFWVMELVKKEMALDFGKVALLENGILSFVAAANLDTITLSQLEELLAVFVEITDGKPMPFYSDNTQMKSLGHQERKYIGDNLHLFATASAVKENSISVRFIGNAIKHVFPPKVPMQMFKTKEEAFDWLGSLE